LNVRHRLILQKQKIIADLDLMGPALSHRTVRLNRSNCGTTRQRTLPVRSLICRKRSGLPPFRGGEGSEFCDSLAFSDAPAGQLEADRARRKRPQCGKVLLGRPPFSLGTKSPSVSSPRLTEVGLSRRRC
jgi:hypothetical protein